MKHSRNRVTSNKLMVALIGNTQRGKTGGENFDKLITSHQNLSDFPLSKFSAIYGSILSLY